MIRLDFGAFSLQRPSTVFMTVPLSFSFGEMSYSCLTLFEVTAFECNQLAHAKPQRCLET